MQDTVFLATYIGFMMTLTWMGVAILYNLRQPRQIFFVSAKIKDVSDDGTASTSGDSDETTSDYDDQMPPLEDATVTEDD